MEESDNHLSEASGEGNQAEPEGRNLTILSEKTEGPNQLITQKDGDTYVKEKKMKNMVVPGEGA